MAYAPIGYTYEADHHCTSCTEARFEGSLDDTVDNEGNPVRATYSWDVEDRPLACGTCREVFYA